MRSNEILSTFKQYEHELRSIYLCVYSHSTGEQMWRDVYASYEHEDARAIVKSLHQLYMDADDTVSFLQDSVWDVVLKLSADAITVEQAFRDIVASTVSVEAVPIEENNDGTDV